MAITWQDTQQVRMQDASGTLNALNKAAEMTTSGISNALDTAVKNVTDARQQEIQSRQADASRFGAVSSGVNALGNMLETQRKMSPEYQAMEKAKTQAALANAYSSLAGTKQEIDTQNIIRSELGLPPIQFDMPDISTFGFGGATTPAPVDQSTVTPTAPIVQSNAVPATALDASVAKVTPQPTVGSANTALVNRPDRVNLATEISATSPSMAQFTQSNPNAPIDTAVNQTPLDQRISNIQEVSSQNAPQDQTTTVTQPALQTGFKNYSLVGTAGNQLGPVLQRRYDETNATALGNEFQERLTAVSGGNGSQVAIDALRKDMTEMLNANGIQGDDAKRILNTTFGSIGVTPAKDSETARALDLRDQTIATIDSAITLNENGQITNVNIDRIAPYSLEELQKAKGTTLGNQIYQATLNQAYNDAENATEDAQFTAPEGSSMVAVDNRANRDAYAKYKAFSDRVAFHYPNNETTRNQLTARYLRENKLDKDIITSVDKARSADMAAAVRTVTQELQTADYLAPADINRLATQIAGIPHNMLGGIHDIMISKVVDQTKVEDSGSGLKNANGVPLTFFDEAKEFLNMDYKGFGANFILQRQKSLDTFGDRLNEWVNDSIPGADTATRAKIVEATKLQLGFERIQKKIDTQKKRNSASADFFQAKEFTSVTHPNVEIMFAKEKYSAGDYNTNEANELKTEATNFNDAAIQRLIDENLIDEKDLQLLDRAILKKIGLGVFGDMMSPDSQVTDSDEWVFSDGIVNDWEIEAQRSVREQGQDVRTLVDWGQGNNAEAWPIYTRLFQNKLDEVKAARNNYINAKVKE